VFGSARVFGDAVVSGSARVFGDAVVSGSARVSENAMVSGSARVSENAMVSENARVKSSSDILVIGPVGSRNDYLTITVSNGLARVGCFTGSLDELEAAANEKHRQDYLDLLPAIRAIVARRQAMRKEGVST
jgi:carbonic anhydrase/acetyltransferase-like protein (isoleucine patch superfamily)